MYSHLVFMTIFKACVVVFYLPQLFPDETTYYEWHNHKREEAMKIYLSLLLSCVCACVCACVAVHRTISEHYIGFGEYI